MTGSSKLVCDFTVNGNCGRASRTSDYSMTCYLNKKELILRIQFLQI